jgi:hypothetical protein
MRFAMTTSTTLAQSNEIATSLLTEFEQELVTTRKFLERLRTL